MSTALATDIPPAQVHDDPTQVLAALQVFPWFWPALICTVGIGLFRIAYHGPWRTGLTAILSVAGVAVVGLNIVQRGFGPSRETAGRQGPPAPSSPSTPTTALPKTVALGPGTLAPGQPASLTWLWITLAILAAVVLVLAAWWLAQNVTQTRRRAAAERERRQAAVREREDEWNKYRKTLATIQAEYAAFESDTLKPLLLPALTDVRQPETAAFHNCLKAAADLDSENVPARDEKITDLGAAVGALDTAVETGPNDRATHRDEPSPLRHPPRRQTLHSLDRAVP